MNMYVALGCVNVPKVIKCMQTRIQVIILVINNSPSQIKPKFLYIYGCAKPSEVYLVLYEVVKKL